MTIARQLLLRASKSQWLAQQFRRRRFAQRAVARFIPGETANHALSTAQALQDQGLRSVLTELGENVTTVEEVRAVTSHYTGVLDRIRAMDLACQVSVKPTHLGLDLDSELCAQQVQQLAQHAGEQQNFIWIDMESSPYVEATLKLYETIRQVQSNTGICLQAYLYRSADDLSRVLDAGGAVRLVKGAYNEPARIAFPKKADVDANYMTLADRTLDSVRAVSGVPAFATHDMGLIRRIQSVAATKDVRKDKFEVQMLYGIGREHQRQLAQEQSAVRVLVSYGAAWFPWYMRRLAERPANMWFMVRSALTR